MKIISALAVVAALALALPATAMAQQTVGANGQALDGMGAGGNVANHYRFDGPPNADVTSLSTSELKLWSTRLNQLDCDINAKIDCPQLANGHKVAASFL
jgi:hypothetical protein